MKKAVLMSIQPKWVDMMESGLKKFEFRGNNFKNVKKGMTAYMYESQRSKKVVAKFVIGELYKIGQYSFNVHLINNGSEKEEVKGYEELYKQGYVDQPYAIEITNFEMIEPKDVTEFVLWNEYVKYYKDVLDDNSYYGKNTGGKNMAVGENYYWEMKCNSNVKRPPQSFCYVVDEE